MQNAVGTTTNVCWGDTGVGGKVKFISVICNSLSCIVSYTSTIIIILNA